MTAVVTAEADDPDKIAAAVAECERMKILILPPDVNFSQTGFAIEKMGDKEGIRFGLSAIKNVGKAAIEAILTEREKSGSFKSLNDFVKRVNLRVVNRKTLESLIKAGAMDKFGKRNAMLSVLDDLKNSGVSLSRSIAQGQGSLFDAEELEKHTSNTSSIDSVLQSVQEAAKEEILSWERELLGFYLTEHPLTKVQSKIDQITHTKIADIDPLSQTESSVKICGIVVSVRKTLTKRNKEEMCFAKIQDITGSLEIIVFPRAYSQAKGYLMPDQIVVVSG